VFESIRWRLCEKVHQSRSNRFDVGLSTIPKHNERATANLSQVGGLAAYISPMEDFQKYIAILDMDGNSWSSRFGTLLCYNSVVIKVEPRYVDFFYYDLKPWTHFVPVRDDLSDLFSTVEYVLDPRNADEMKDIISAANTWCATRFHPMRISDDIMNIFESYIRKLDLADPNWSDEWIRVKTQLLLDSNLDIIEI
jgi:Glycosyl transferase family 90